VRPDPVNETDTAWARDHFHPYLLLRLNEDDDERMHDALARAPSLADELEDAEEALMDEWIDCRMNDADRADFERIYVSGAEFNRAKLVTRKMLRLPAAAVQPAPRSEWRVRPLVWVAACALVMAGVFSLLWYRHTQNRAQVVQAPPSVHRVEERPAGETAGDAFRLPAGTSDQTLTVAAAPRGLVWGPVPDYRIRYRLHIQSKDGERLSPWLDSHANDISFEIPETQRLTLPWRVSVLSERGGQPLVSFTLTRP